MVWLKSSFSVVVQQSVTLTLFLGITLLSTSCSTMRDAKQKRTNEAMQNAPAGLIAKPQVKGMIVAGGGPQIRLDRLPVEKDIIWAPEDENIPIPGFEFVTPSQRNRDNWEVSYSEAVKAARSRGKPILMWFTDSARSQNCKLLGRELFEQSEFEEWAKENVILLRLDNAIDRDDVEKVNYMKNLRKRYKVLGNPVIILVSPSGKVLNKLVGYSSGRSRSTMEKIETAYHFAMLDYGQWREEMERKGYRMWVDLKGRQVFAKLAKYHEGNVWLIEVDGTKGRTHESKLSDADQAWIESEKLKRL